MNSNFEVELLSLLKFIARLKEAKHIKNKGIINAFSFKQARNRNSKFGPLDIFPCNSSNSCTIFTKFGDFSEILIPRLLLKFKVDRKSLMGSNEALNKSFLVYSIF